MTTMTLASIAYKYAIAFLLVFYARPVLRLGRWQAFVALVLFIAALEYAPLLVLAAIAGLITRYVAYRCERELSS